MSVNLATGPHPSIRRGGSDSKKRPDMLLPLSPTSPCGSGLSGKREAGRSAPSLRFLQDTPNYVDAEGERDVDPAQLPPPTLILPHVFLGSQFDAVDPDRLKAFAITHVLNVSANCVQSPHVSSRNFLRIPAVDNFGEQLLPHFATAFTFLDGVRESGGRALIHCHAGISRSPTFAIGYVMHCTRCTSEEAYR
jgi:hypothetical protein